MKRNYFGTILSLFVLATIICGGYVAASAQTLPSAQFNKRYDFNGDGKADVSLYSTDYDAGNRGSFYIANSPNDQFRGVQWGGSGNGFTDEPIAGDFDGDGRGDFAVIRIESGVCAWYILNNQATSYRRVAFGTNNNQFVCETPVPADYDGDGKDDIAVARRNASGNTFSYYWIRSTDGQIGGRTVSYETANTECRPTLPGDYNGDRKADFVVRCRLTATNQQYFNITDNAANTTQRVFWGIFTAYTNNGTTYFPEGDIFVPGDYDGDGKTDLAVVRDTLSSSGSNDVGSFTWYIRRSSDGALQAQRYGGHDSSSYRDFPTPADYDGDGKTDLAVIRYVGFNLSHFIQNSSTGATRALSFGFNNLEVRRDGSLISKVGASGYTPY